MSDVADDHGLARLYTRLASVAGHAEPLERLQLVCREAVDLLGVVGVAVTITAAPTRPHAGLATVSATDDVIGGLPDRQHAAGEGPSIDASRLDHPVREPAMATGGRQRWPRLADTAVEAGLAAVFSFPLSLDGASAGTLDAYRPHPGDLTDGQFADGRLLAAVLVRELRQINTATSPPALRAAIGHLSADRAVIEQASGMVAVQLGVPVSEAARRLRAHAHDQQRRVADVARDIVNRGLRLS